jgi:ATP-binding cassette subfamily F protein 3
MHGSANALGRTLYRLEFLRFHDLECHYGAREVFSGASGVLREGERIGLVGANGAGKSSLLRLLAGVDAHDGGSIARAKDAKLGYLAQGVADETGSTLEALVEAALERADPAHWGMRNKMLRTMLAAFGFSGEDYARPLREFSGGQRAKAALAHLLIDEPDYLILDEPTNHLDVATVRWLEAFIAADRRAYVIVSHDRYFLDRVATAICEIDRGKLHAYAPARHAYTAFLAQKEERLERERIAYEAYIAERDKRRTTIAGLRATHTSSDYAQVRSREKQLARIEAGQAAPAPAPPRRGIAVRLEAARRAGNGFALETASLSKAYARPLFTGLDLAVERGERLAVVGPNGSGKSTFLKILSGEVQADGGNIRYNPGAQVAYFAQNSHDQLDVTKSAVDAVLASADLTPQAARTLLGRMRISGDAADKAVRDFSGGERRRIMLACLMARKADVLLLDEPTNDLDIESREALESVLCEYEGAIVVVSHDRFLLARLCDRVLWIEDGRWGVVAGGYDAYEASARARETARFERAAGEQPERSKASRQTPLRVRSQLQSRIDRIEREIASTDARIAEIDAAFAQPELYQDRDRVKALEAEIADLRLRNRERVIEWERLLHDFENALSR